MSITVDIKVTGLKEFEANLAILREEFGVKTGGLINRSLMAAAVVVRDEARRLAPVLQDAVRIQAAPRSGKRRRSYIGTVYRRRGALKAGIIASYVKGGGLQAVVRVRNRGYIFEHTHNSRIDRLKNPALAGNPNYWWLVEFGTSKKSARPFLRPAFESQKDKALNAFKARMERELQETFAKFRQPMRLAA